MDTIFFQEFLYEVLLVLSRCYFHHPVENLIFYKKDIQPFFYIGPRLFSENKIIRSVVGRKVDGQILFGARSKKPKILFGARGEKPKIYSVPNDSYETIYLAVNGLTCDCIDSLRVNMTPSSLTSICSICIKGGGGM